MGLCWGDGLRPPWAGEGHRRDEAKMGGWGRGAFVGSMTLKIPTSPPRVVHRRWGPRWVWMGATERGPGARGSGARTLRPQFSVLSVGQ